MGEPQAPDGRTPKRPSVTGVPQDETPGSEDGGPKLRVFTGRQRRAPEDSRGHKAATSPDDLLTRLQTLEAQVEDALAHSRLRGGGVGQDLLLEGLNTAIRFYGETRRLLGDAGKSLARLRLLGRGGSVDDYGYDPAAARWIEPVLEALFRHWWRVKVINIDRVPMRGPVVLVANHGGTLLPYDALMITTALRCLHPARRRVRPFIEDYLYYWPHLGTMLARLGAVRADRANARRLLASGDAIVVFPEGMRGLSKRYRDRYRLERFGRGGFVSVCLETRAVLVPVSVIGGEEVYPALTRLVAPGRMLGLPYLPVTPTFPWLGPLGLVPLPTKWTIRFGDPIGFAGQYETANPTDPAVVGRLREDVRQRIQRMLVDGLRKRQSLFFG